MLSWLSSLLSTGVELPSQWLDCQFDHAPMLAIDLELTGLDAQQARILSIGWTEGKANCVKLESCFYRVIRTRASLEQSPVIHGLVEEDIQQGSPVREIIEQLLPYASTHVWVFHNAALDMAVLTKTCEKLDITLPPIVTLDTLQLGVHLLKKSHEIPPPDAATLTACRQRHGLPLAPAHNALDDAMATLELLWAQMAKLDPNGKMKLQELGYTGALKVFS